MNLPSRPIGLLASTLFIAAIAAIALLQGGDGLPEPEGPPPDPRNGRVFIQDNLWTANERQYAVWVGSDGTPYAGRRPSDGGDWDVVDLGRLPNNPLDAPTAMDDHNVYVLGVDASGHVHVAGNMHTSSLHYLRSRAPGLEEWTSFEGPMPTDSVTYPAFVGLPDGTLLFFRRQGAVGTGSVELLDALPPGAARWRSYGAVIDGRPSAESAYLHHVAVDPTTGTMHLLFEWRGTAGPNTTNDLGYARSTDGGRTWQRSDGTPLDKPITHTAVETVIDTGTVGSGLLNQGGLTIDVEGRPHAAVVFRRPGEPNVIEHVWLDDGAWRRETVDDTGFEGRPQIVGMPDGRVWLIGVADTVVEAVDITPDRERADTQTLARVPSGWEVTYDSQALADEGVLKMLIPSGDDPRVVEADLMP